MKKYLLLASLFLATVTNAQCPPPPPGAQETPCPPPPDGFCPYVEAFAHPEFNLQMPTALYFPPDTNGNPILTAIRIEFQETIGQEYEVQFTRSLSPVQWIAYARWTAQKTDTVLTDCPIYPCDPHRFFRVMVKTPPVIQPFRFRSPIKINGPVE